MGPVVSLKSFRPTGHSGRLQDVTSARLSLVEPGSHSYVTVRPVDWRERPQGPLRLRSGAVKTLWLLGRLVPPPGDSSQLCDWSLVSRNPGVGRAREKMAAMAVGGAGGSRVSSGRDLNCVPEIADTLGAVAKQG